LTTTIDAPVISTDEHGDVPAVSAAVVRNEEGGVVIFLANRSLESQIDATIDLSQLTSLASILEATTLGGPDYNVLNTKDDPKRVLPQPNSTAQLDGTSLLITLPAVSWSMIRLGA
jgi:alpha-N-arabinofuranosidase